MIRLATMDDVLSLVPLAEEFFAQTEYAVEWGMEINNEHLIDQLAYMVSADKCGILLAEEEGRLLGTVGMQLFPLWMNRDHLTGMEMFYYVHPSYRGSGVAGELHEAMEKWVADNGADSFTMLAIERINGSAVGQIYDRLGYKKIETSYSKRIGAS